MVLRWSYLGYRITLVELVIVLPVMFDYDAMVELSWLQICILAERFGLQTGQVVFIAMCYTTVEQTQFNVATRANYEMYLATRAATSEERLACRVVVEATNT